MYIFIIIWLIFDKNLYILTLFFIIIKLFVEFIIFFSEIIFIF